MPYSAQKETLDIAIIGAGPRGLSVLERLLVRAAKIAESTALRIWIFEPAEPGVGRIWRTTQPDWFLMNTAAGEVSIFTNGPDDGPTRAGSGPSFAQWLSTHSNPEWANLGPDGYGPRAAYGEYLAMAYDAMVRQAPTHVLVRHIPHTATGMTRKSGRSTLTHDGGGSITVDKAILTTGHPTLRPTGEEIERLTFAEQHPGLRYLLGDSAADLPLADIAPGESVGVIGLGLTFFDVMAALTVGRGGSFSYRSGQLEYQASGAEPNLVAGSRSGLVMLARGRNQKKPTYRYRPTFFTKASVTAARRNAQRRSGSSQLDFRADLLPLLQREVEHAYYLGQVREQSGIYRAQDFADRHLMLSQIFPHPELSQLLQEFSIDHLPPLDLEQLARPFAGQEFADPREFHDELLTLLTIDLNEASAGNLDNPLKAALDILRDTRGVLRQAVDGGGLRAQSHDRDFLNWFNPINTMVSAGPPMIRVAQACALIRAGVLQVVGPATTVHQDANRAAFVLESPQVGHSQRAVTTVIDARIPRPTITQDANPLMNNLLESGLISEFVNHDSLSGLDFHTGAVASIKTPFRVTNRAGRVDPNLYALGVPTENNRWFTQIGNGRPGPMTGFHADADALAQDVLRGLVKVQPTVAAASESHGVSASLS
jgi:uncharacterized NAD(P)/FAD-binding protein YdhS